jgi:putative nucleotidyltransferase with HDIG domain
MKEEKDQSFVAVEHLRLGMFVHLDLGWLSHPFPRSGFQLSAAEQIETIRQLGLRRVRWSPDRSDLGAPQPQAAAQEEKSAPAETVDIAEAVADAKAAEPTTEASLDAEARRRHALALAAQRASLRACEKRFNEAARTCSQAFGIATTQPQRAREHSEQLVHGIVEQMLDAPDLVIRALGDVAGDKAALHAVNVATVSLLLSRVLGVADQDLRDTGVGALLHDIGKSDLPPAVRHHDDHFSASETAYYREHVANGVATGRKMGLQPGALLVIEQHHEHADASGFPQALNSDRMTLGARIVALVNRYDNLCNPHIAAKALTPHEALSMLFAQGKNHFDTAVLGAFIKMMGVYPPGSVVQLTDDRYAVVAAVNSNRPLKPRVLVHDPAVPRDEALLLDLESAPGLGIRRSLRPLQLPRAAHDYLLPRPRVVYFFEPAAQRAPAECAA